MIVRIVRLEFQPDQLPAFHDIFDQHKGHIRAFPGCMHLALHADPQHEQVRYTYSHWESQAALDAYRHSALFAKVWPQTKALFAAKPQAYSMVLMETIAPA